MHSLEPLMYRSACLGTNTAFLQGYLAHKKQRLPETLQGYLGYKVTSARGSVGRRFLILNKPRAKPVGLRFLY